MISQQYLDLLDYYAINAFPLGKDETLHELWNRLKRSIKADRGYFDISATLAGIAAWCYNELSKSTPRATLISKAKELHKAKNAGYSGDNEDPWYNFRECEDFGISAADGIITRMCDKYRRYTILSVNPNYNQVQESIEDTLMDLAAYSLILICVMGEE